MSDTVIILPGEGTAEAGIVLAGQTGTILTPGADLIKLPLSNVWATVEAQDVFAAVGYPGYPGTQVSIALTETPDVVAIVGNVAAVGTLAFTERQDTFSAYIKQTIAGTMAVTEAQDVFAALGFGRGVNGTLALTETQDVVSVSIMTPLTGTMNMTETPDRVHILGNGVSRVRPRRPVFVT